MRGWVLLPFWPAMFNELNAITDFSDKNPPKGKFFVIADSHCDGSFIIHHFLSLYLKGGLPVCFVALAQSLSHYSNVAQKLGVNLSSAQENGQLVFVDGLSLASEALSSIEEEPIKTQNENPFSQIRESTFTLQPLYEQIRQAVENKPGCLLLIDDVSILLSLGVSVQNTSYFLQYCYTLMYRSMDAGSGCLVSLVHADRDADDEDALLLWKQICHWADIEFHVQGLSSGYCKDVHGQLSITWRNNSVLPKGHKRKTFQFKVQDKNVRFFAPGTSKAVL